MGRFLSFLMFLIPVVTTAQTVFGIKGGLNIADIVMTNYIDPDVEGDLGIKLGMHGGLFVNGTVNDRVGMTAELLYSNKGVRGGGSNVNLHYIALPLLVQYGLTDKISTEIGPELGYLFSARSERENVSNTYNNKFDLALDAGFRLNTPRVIFGLRYCVGIFSVREPIETIGPSGNEKIKYQNRVLQLCIGYKLWTLE
jgi:hypothetical protein